MKLRGFYTFRAWLTGGIAVAALALFSSVAATAPTISDDAATALLQMGKTLQSTDFSFEVATIRQYADKGGDALHIYHRSTMLVHRPDRLQVMTTGDDGATKLFYDGKNVVLVGFDPNKYSTIAAPNTIQKMMEEVMGRLHVDFPLADFLTDAPNKAFLTGVTSGHLVDTATIDGVECRHFFFSQAQGIELELWLEKNDQSLPRRLIITYRGMPTQPQFIAAFSKWNFTVHPTDADFAYQAPSGATQVPLEQLAAVTR